MASYLTAVVSARRIGLPAALALLCVGALAAVAAALARPPSTAGERTVAAGRQPVGLAVDDARGHVFVVSYGDSALRMYAANGSPLYRVALSGPLGPISVDPLAARAFVVTGGNTGVTTVDTRDGRMLYTAALGAAEQPAIAVDGATRRVFVTGEAGVDVLDATGGRLVRAVPLTIAPNALVALAIDGRAGHVFVADRDDGAVFMLDARSGHVLRTTRVAGGPAGIVVDERTGRAFVTSAFDNAVAVLDTRSGRVLRTVSLAVSTSDAPMAVDERLGLVFIAAPGASGCGTLLALDAYSGDRRRTGCTGELAAPRAMAVDETSGRVFVAGDAGVAIIDARTGALLGTTATGVSDLAGIAVDIRAGRVYAVGQQSDAPGPAAGGRSNGWLEGLAQRIPWLSQSPTLTPIPPGTGVLLVFGAS